MRLPMRPGLTSDRLHETMKDGRVYGYTMNSSPSLAAKTYPYPSTVVYDPFLEPVGECLEGCRTIFFRLIDLDRHIQEYHRCPHEFCRYLRLSVPEKLEHEKLHSTNTLGYTCGSCMVNGKTGSLLQSWTTRKGLIHHFRHEHLINDAFSLYLCTGEFCKTRKIVGPVFFVVTNDLYLHIRSGHNRFQQGSTEKTPPNVEYPPVLPMNSSVQARKVDAALLRNSSENIAHRCGIQSNQQFIDNSDILRAFTSQIMLGVGAIGEVDSLQNPTGSFECLARKRIRISRRQKLRERELQLVQDEVSNMMRLNHPHIIKVIGAFEENAGTRNHFSSILMYPVGDNDLGAFLEDSCKCIQEAPHSETSLTYTRWLWSWFFCLASALRYMHSQNLHHEDIKPSNIIHRGEHIYFTDFSSSRKFEAGQATSTANPAQASLLFAAPEALPDQDGKLNRHGSRTDVFSLGLVFVEMFNVLLGQNIDSLHDFVNGYNGFSDENWRYRQYYRVVKRFDDWFTIAQNDAEIRFYTTCIKPMVRLERKNRPSAAEVVDIIRRDIWTRNASCPCNDTLYSVTLGEVLVGPFVTRLNESSGLNLTSSLQGRPSRF